jgi:hypothetical protein
VDKRQCKSTIYLFTVYKNRTAGVGSSIPVPLCGIRSVISSRRSCFGDRFRPATVVKAEQNIASTWKARPSTHAHTGTMIPLEDKNDARIRFPSACFCILTASAPYVVMYGEAIQKVETGGGWWSSHTRLTGNLNQLWATWRGAEGGSSLGDFHRL